MPPLLSNLAQIPVIAPLAPHERRPHHKLLGTDRANHAGHPLTKRRDARLVRDVVYYLVVRFSAASAHTVLLSLRLVTDF